MGRILYTLSMLCIDTTCTLIYGGEISRLDINDIVRGPWASPYGVPKVVHPFLETIKFTCIIDCNE